MKNKELLRWALADHAFREAIELTNHILESKIDPESHLFSGAATGVAVCYCRPFMEAAGLGSLPAEMKSFKGAPLAEILTKTHNALFEARNKQAAHFDRLHHERQFREGKLLHSPSIVKIHLVVNGCAVETTGTYISPEVLEYARNLLQFQIKRVGEKLGSFGAELLVKHQQFTEITFQVDDESGEVVFQSAKSEGLPPTAKPNQNLA